MTTEKNREEIDVLITSICKWIEKELENTSNLQGCSILPSMIDSLADLVKSQD